MQKLINGVALLSGLVSLSVIGSGAYLYLNKEAIVEDIKENVAAAATEAIAGALPGMMDAVVPTIPNTTGPAVPYGETGPSILKLQ